MDNKSLYKNNKFTIENISKEDRIEYFEILEDEFIKNKSHNIEYINERKALKQEVKRLYTDDKDITWVIKYENKFIGFFQILPKDKIKVPVATDIYIIKSYRKTKALACVIYYVSHILYPNTNIQVESKYTPGFDKMLYVVAPGLSAISIFDQTLKQRVAKILGEKNRTI